MLRRRFVRAALVSGLLASPVARVVADTATLEKTPRDYEGPYYPKGPRNHTSDLITGEPRQSVLHLHGRLTDIFGKPVTGAMVDIWQTDPLGHYKHPSDQSSARRWEDFLYWGEARTNAQGDFEFRTYVPGAYVSRPAHIHYKIWKNKRPLLTSQVYFKQLGGPANRSRSSRAARLQTVELQEAGGAMHASVKVVI